MDSPPPGKLSERIASLEQTLRDMEEQMRALQHRYEETALHLNALNRLQRLLKQESIPTHSVITWASVCRLKGWDVTSGTPHRTVKRYNPRLHALLHQATLGEHCTVDRATYALE